MIEGSKWVAVWSVGRAGAMIWTVRAVTAHGVYVTSPGSRSSGHLLAPRDFAAQYVPV